MEKIYAYLIGAVIAFVIGICRYYGRCFTIIWFGKVKEIPYPIVILLGSWVSICGMIGDYIEQNFDWRGWLIRNLKSKK